MAKKKDIDIVAAGHTCLDLIPAFTIDGKVDKMTDVLVPGKMINMGNCVVVGGGPVTNAGVSIRRLGMKTELIGKVGDDDFGNQIIRWYEEHEGHFKGIHQVKGESTSYTIAICIPGIDWIRTRALSFRYCGGFPPLSRRDAASNGHPGGTTSM